MQKLSRMAVSLLLLSVVLLSSGYANPNSKQDNGYQRPTVKKQLNVPYKPSVTRSGVLFVEDPGDAGFGPPTKPDPVWVNVLNEILGTGNYGWFGPITDPAANGPDSATMAGYDLVIWNTYDFWWDMALTSTDQANLQNYINAGGKVWLLGQDIIYSGVPLAWFTANFHLASVTEDYCSDEVTLNLEGLAEINGITFTANCDYQSNGYWCDALTPDAQAHHIIHDLTYSQYNSIAFPNTAPLQTSFWTVDGRGPSPWSGWVDMVTGMLQAFGVYGIEEIPQKSPARKLGISIKPSILTDLVTISYNIPTSEQTTIKIYDRVGKIIKSLVDSHKSSGGYQIKWDGTDENGSNVPNGIYFVKITCGITSCCSPITVIR